MADDEVMPAATFAHATRYPAYVYPTAEIITVGISATEDGPVSHVPAELLTELQRQYRANLDALITAHTPGFPIADSCWCGSQPPNGKARPHRRGGDQACRFINVAGYRPPEPTTPGERWCHCKQQTIPQGHGHIDADGIRHRSTEGCRPTPDTGPEAPWTFWARQPLQPPPPPDERRCNCGRFDIPTVAGSMLLGGAGHRRLGPCDFGESHGFKPRTVQTGTCGNCSAKIVQVSGDHWVHSDAGRPVCAQPTPEATE